MADKISDVREKRLPIDRPSVKPEKVRFPSDLHPSTTNEIAVTSRSPLATPTLKRRQRALGSRLRSTCQGRHRGGAGQAASFTSSVAKLRCQPLLERDDRCALFVCLSIAEKMCRSLDASEAWAVERHQLAAREFRFGEAARLERDAEPIGSGCHGQRTGRTRVVRSGAASAR